jgi:predicted O-methyltransferase YrrM
MSEELEEYILSHIDDEGDALARLNRETHIYHLRPRMCSGHLQGRLLKMFVRMINPQNILELGTFTGYSALCLAEGLIAPDGELHTIEIDDELEDFIRSHFEASPFADRIHLHIGDARDILPTIDKTFDLVFMDANKREYSEYYDLVFPRLAPGGFIIADNTLWDGKVVDWGKKLDAQTEGILKFNDYVAQDDRVEKVIIPLRDGLTIIYKKPQ